MGEAGTDIARCISKDLDSINLMKSISTPTIQSLLCRMGIEYQEGLPKEAYLIAWQEEFLGDWQWILRIYPESYLHLLLEIWEKNEIEMDDLRWEMLQYLKLFGLLTYKKTGRKQKEVSEIYYSDSMKQNFYFFLKSKDSQGYMRKYERWETAFCGMSYYYGLIPLRDAHKLVCQVLGESIEYDTFVTFIKCRADIWSLGSFLGDNNGKEYFQNHNVEQVENTLLFIQEHPNLSYKEISYPDLEYVRHGYGIDNRWPGISELGNFLVQEMGITYYRATVLVHTMITATQNGAEKEKILGQLDLITFEKDLYRQQAIEFVERLYDHVPVYEYKGYTYSEIRKKESEKEWKNRRKGFTIISGGKL